MAQLSTVRLTSYGWKAPIAGRPPFCAHSPSDTTLHSRALLPPLGPGATPSAQMICLTSLASESAIGASAIRLEYSEIVGSRYCPDGRFGWLVPIAAWPPDTRPLTLAPLPQASARSQAGGPGASLSSRALFSEIGVPDPPIGAGANWPGIRHLSQAKLAQALETTQGEISKIEHRTDLYLSTLRNYIEAMGGELDIIARFKDGAVRISTFQDINERGSHA
jgi:hypothetical protein